MLTSVVVVVAVWMAVTVVVVEVDWTMVLFRVKVWTIVDVFV